MPDKTPTGREVLDLQLAENDSGASTVRGYLAALLNTLWDEGSSFLAERPFGNFGWHNDFDGAFADEGWVTFTYDASGYVDVDSERVDALVKSAIKALGEVPV